ncbi:MAG: hypothetical protein PVG30_07110 [Gammaproteobacteria bacterium]|jgi:hypothetical protein
MENKNKYFSKKRSNSNCLKQKKITATYRTISREFPQMSRLMLKDLMQIDGYSDIEIGFASGVGLDIIRKIAMGNTCCVSKTTFLRLLGLYARVFCDWFALREDEL